MNADNEPLISGDALRAAASDYLTHIQARAATEIPGIFDKWFMRVIARLTAFPPGTSWEDGVRDEISRDAQRGRGLEWDFLRLRWFLDRRRHGRFVSYDRREKSGAHYFPKYGTEFGGDVLLTCQGTTSFLQWRGLPLMKTVFDFALYPQLLAALKPQTIFEIGSGSGGSAIWLADQLAMLGIQGHVHSADLVPVQTTHTGVAFYQGDCSSPPQLFSPEILNAAPHPWLVIEDAHHNVEAVLNYLHTFLKPGDYLVVEDSEIKRDDIRRFVGAHAGCYLVDTKYTDFFGRNATCALDSIFIRTDNTHPRS